MPRAAINEIGNIYDWLSVIKEAGSHKTSRNKMWECLCRCGKTIVAVGSALRKNAITSCGCKHSRNLAKDGLKKCFRCGLDKNIGEFCKDRESPDGISSVCVTCSSDEWAEYNRTPRGCVMSLISSGKGTKGLDPSPLIKQVEDGYCAVTGLPFVLKTKRGERNWRRPSIDHIVPRSRGGKRNCNTNVRMVCDGVNAMMGYWGIGPILEVADAIRAKQNNERSNEHLALGTYGLV